MTKSAPGRLRFTHFTSFAPAGSPTCHWNHTKSRNFDYLNIDHWIKLAQALESAKFDAFFWADHSGVNDIYQGSYATTVREAIQFPLGDPLLLTAALASSTSDLGFAFSANVIQDHPYAFARRLSTLDHLTRGRIAWNIVTSFQPSAWRNFGHTEMANHAARYDQAEEYVQVLYKLLEGSWEDDAVVRDLERRVFAEPEKVHPIGHEGKYYTVPGIHTNEPSPQRLPLLFQAGSSSEGRAFAGRNAEAIFIAAHNPGGAKTTINDMRSHFEANGRRESDGLYFNSLNVIVGSTEDEAKRKYAEAQETRGSEASLAYMSALMGTDLSRMDVDTPVGDFKTDALQGQFKILAENAPDKSFTFREIVNNLTKPTYGTPEQLADTFAEYQAAGVDGINICNLTGPEDTYDFIEHVVPVLQERGLMQKEYAPGTLREKLFAGTDSPSGPRLNERHPAARYRQNNRVLA